LPPFWEAFEVLAIFAARSLLIPFFFRPSYCFSFLTLEPWSLAILGAPFVGVWFFFFAGSPLPQSA